MARKPAAGRQRPRAGGAAPAAKVRGLALGLAAIEALLSARAAQGVTQVASSLGIAPSSAHDLLASLADLGFVAKDPVRHSYRLSAGAFRLVHSIAEHFGPNPKIANLLPRIASRHRASVYIHTLCGLESMLIGAVGEYAPSTSLGISTPAYASAAGKILVAQLPEESWPDFAPVPGAQKLTPFTDTDPKRFLREIRLARERGFATAERTSAIEVCAIAAPIPQKTGPPRYSVALLYPHEEWLLKCLPDLKDAVLCAAAELARAL